MAYTKSAGVLGILYEFEDPQHRLSGVLGLCFGIPSLGMRLGTVVFATLTLKTIEPCDHNVSMLSEILW